MRYYLQTAILAAPKPLRISRSEFEQLVQARATLIAAFPLEENFDLLLGNYLELEKLALSLAATSMVRRIGGYQEMSDKRSDLNRGVVNLLTAARLFVDQMPQRVLACGPDPKPVRSALAKEYDSHFEYRFMEALRNHVQHRGSAVHSLSFSGDWLPKGKRERQEYSITVYALRSELNDDGSFKKSVLRECPEKVDLLRTARVYVESLGTVHQIVRTLVDEKIREARQAVEGAIARYKKHTKASTLGLTAFAAIGDDVKTRVPVMLEWENVRMELARRNGTLVNLPKRYVTSAADDA